MADQRYIKDYTALPPPASTIALAGFLLALLAALTAVLSGLGTRWELWGFRTGLQIFRLTAYGGVISAVVSIAGIFSSFLLKGVNLKRSFLLSLAGLLIGAIVILVPLRWSILASSVPPIHDISTDTDNPPRFASLETLRPNPSVYGGLEVAALQHRRYPDIRPLDLDIPPDKAFDIALETAKDMGWQILDSSRPEGRIEAVDTTFWFGFKDDIAVRITRLANGSRIDVRSVSRVGRSDIGTNAKRIHDYFKTIKKGLEKTAG